MAFGVSQKVVLQTENLVPVLADLGADWRNVVRPWPGLFQLAGQTEQSGFVTVSANELHANR